MTVHLDFLASHRHFVDHLAPIWFALRPTERGQFVGVGAEALTRARMLGIRAVPRQRGPRPTVIASHGDAPKCHAPWLIYMEHGAGQCLVPETKVLTADMRWEPVGDLQIGDELLAFEENPTVARYREWRRSFVVATRRIELPCYELEFSDGTTVVASGGHLWLRRENQQFGWLSTESLQDRETYPKHSSKLVKCFDVWDHDQSWSAGYLAAAFDGEGFFTQTRRPPRQNRMMLGFCQKPNAMLDLVLKELAARGFPFSTAQEKSGVTRVNILGGSRETLRLIGSIRPRRLLQNFVPLDNGQMRGLSVELLRKTFVGNREVVGIVTTTGTLIAEGLASHNSYGGEPPDGSAPSFEERCPVALFLCPSERVARRNQLHHPHAMSVAVGCPKLDAFRLTGRALLPQPRPTVALAFHWPSKLCPETMWAYPDYGMAISAMARAPRSFELLGHGHPRAWTTLRAEWRRLRIPHTPFSDQVLRDADVLVVDNSSIGFEFLAMGKPVVWLNSRHWRRDVEHGMRFWEYADSGLQVDRPDQLVDAITATIAGDPCARRRAEVVPQVYGRMDGQAADRAVAAIRRLLASI